MLPWRQKAITVELLSSSACIQTPLYLFDLAANYNEVLNTLSIIMHQGMIMNLDTLRIASAFYFFNRSFRRFFLQFSSLSMAHITPLIFDISQALQTIESILAVSFASSTTSDLVPDDKICRLRVDVNGKLICGIIPHA